MMNEKNNEKRTMEVVLEDIKTNISDYNLATDVLEKAKLDVALKALETEYNDLALLSVWTDFRAAEIPMVAFAKAYQYAIIGHKDVQDKQMVDGALTIKTTRAIDYTKKRMLDVEKFIEWTEPAGSVAANPAGWRDAMEAARQSIIDQWKPVLAGKKDSVTISLKKMQEALQAMVDALVFIKGTKGGNAVIVKRSVAGNIFAFCNQRKDGLKGSILPGSLWKKQVMDVLHAVVEKKEWTVNYGDEEVVDDTQPAATETAAETK